MRHAGFPVLITDSHCDCCGCGCTQHATVISRRVTYWNPHLLLSASSIRRFHLPFQDPTTQAWLDEKSLPPDMLTEDFDVISLSDYEDGNDSDFGIQSFDGDEEAVLELEARSPSNRSESSAREQSGPGSESSWALLSSFSVDTKERFQCEHYCVRCQATRDPGEQDIESSMQILNCQQWDANCSLLAPLDRHERSNYDFAGRLPEIAFSDSRSASKSKNRWRVNQEKYDGYRYIKPGQLNALHYQSSEPPCSLAPFSSPLETTPVAIMTKRKFYQEAQRAPRPPTYHRRKHNKNYSPWTERYIVRKKERKHALQRIDEELDQI